MRRIWKIPLPLMIALIGASVVTAAAYFSLMHIPRTQGHTSVNFYAAVNDGAPLGNVKINGTYVSTDRYGYYEWKNLILNKTYAFVIEKPEGYYPAWVLHVEGSFSWNETHYILRHTVAETQTDAIEIRFSSTDEAYIKSSTDRLKSVYCDSSSLRFTVTADIGVTSKSEICPSYGAPPQPPKVSGATDWSYDSENEILTIWCLHTSNEEEIAIKLDS